MTAPAPAITALSPVATAAVLCRLAGVLWATVVVKATFQLVHGDVARPVAPLDLVTQDRYHAHGGSLAQARETAPHLPNAGVVLTGHACAPEGRPVPSMSVRLGISRDQPLVDKTLHVFGARAIAAPASVAPFQRMPIVYERAFGGAGVWENPVGTGGPGSSVLPNIVDPREPRRVAGFGPIAPQWAPRRALLGGADPGALEAQVMEAPPGFDWRFFQPAPADQQVPRLRGDEWIVLDGMHPTHARVQSRLPQVMAVARRRAIAGGGGAAEQEIELRADMLVIDADRLIASLIWRGRFAVESAEALGRARVLVGLAQPGKPVDWPALPGAAAPIGQKARGFSAETQDVNLAAILGGAVPFDGGRESALPAAAPAEKARETPMSTGTGMVDLQALLRGRHSVPFAAAEAPESPDGPEGPALPFAAADPSRPPAESVATPASQKATPLSTGTADVDLAQILAKLVPYGGRAPEAAPVRAAVESPRVVAAPAPVAVLPSPAAPLVSQAESPPSPPPAPPPSAAALARKRAQALLAAGKPLDGEGLAGANLSGLDLSGRSLARCDLRGATLRGTRLAGADLTSAVLDEADLRGADLAGAHLSGASLVRANLERASLRGAAAERAVFREACLISADLTAARCASASFEDAVLRDAAAPRANFTAATLHRADLSGAVFRAAIAKSAVFAGATLDRADFQHASLRDADLRSTSRRMARFAGADLTGTVESPHPA